jgi:hypothetical protein
MPSENQRRHTEVSEYLASTEDTRRQSPLRRYWSGLEGTELEREHAREEAAVEKRLARMKSRGVGFATLQPQ